MPAKGKKATAPKASVSPNKPKAAVSPKVPKARIKKEEGGNKPKVSSDHEFAYEC